MKPLSVSDVLARANATMVEADRDVTGALAALLTGITEALPAAGAAVLVESGGGLELLASSSHRGVDHELFEAGADEGPLLEALRTGRPVGACTTAELTRRWPRSAEVVVRAGYVSLEVLPLRWQGRCFGVLAVFSSEPGGFGDRHDACRALADAVTLVLATGHVEARHLAEGLRTVLEERAVVERAKGALACSRSIPVPAAYEALLALAEAEDVTLGVAARRVVERAPTGALDEH